MKYNINISKYIWCTLLAGTVIFSGCKKDEVIAVNKDKGHESDIVTFGIKMSNQWTPDIIGDAAGSVSSNTKASNQTDLVPMDVEGGELGTQIYMYMVEEDVPEVNVTADASTKSSSSIDWVADIGIYAYQVPGNDAVTYNPSATGITTFMDNVRLYEDGTYSGGDKYWPGSGSQLKFYAYRPFWAPANGSEPATNANFTVSTESATSFQPKITYTVPTTVAEQIDILDGVSSLINGNVTDEVEISLSHILSQIEVRAGALEVGMINSISFKNIYNKGDRIVALPSDQGWNVVTGDANKVDYVQTLNRDIKDQNNPVATDDLLGSTMYLMPQTLRDDATIEISLSVTSIDPTSGSTPTNRTHYYTLSKTLKNFIPQWKPNKKYTYILSTPGEIEVAVTDKVEMVGSNPVKSDLKIQNVGLATAYIRVAIFGAWYVDNTTSSVVDGQQTTTTQQLMVGEWKDTDGTFVWCSGGSIFANTADWVKGPDGYYYYKHQLARGEFVKTPLFQTYTLNERGPMANSYLDLTIAVQAVYVNDCTWAWPADALAAVIND